jgi:predicted TIM-barrel fold metal-dependent hydrolase
MDLPVDSHVHVLDPARFPYAADAWYQPVAAETATATQLGHVLDAHGVGSALIVGPNSGYQYDNRCLLDALAHGRGRYRGVAVVRDDASRDELVELKAAGVVGIAFQVALFGVDHYRNIGPLLDRLRDLDLWAQMQVEHDQLVALRPMLEASGARLLFDHCGRPNPAEGLGQPGFQALLELGHNGRACVKLSGLAKCSGLPYPHQDAWPYMHALLEACGPQQLVWASDWPFLRAPARTDYGPLLQLFRELVPDETVRRAILVETPRRLFGFA